MESQGPLAILWVGLGLCCFYIALVWLNTLLGFFLTPLFLIPATWLMDRRKKRQRTTPTTGSVTPGTAKDQTAKR